MSNLKAGFGRANITPPLGIGVCGYYIPRKAEKILDELYASVLTLSVGDKTVAFVGLDAILIARVDCDDIRAYVSEVTGLDENAIFIACSHSHTAPYFQYKSAAMVKDSSDEMVLNYFVSSKFKIAGAVKTALDDMKPAKIGYGVGNAPRISFNRRFRMKDGSVQTNPGVKNPDIVAPIGEVDERVSVIRIDREDGDDIVFVSFGTHPDTIGGNVISADWPGFVRTTLEATLENTKCVFFNGFQGDVNHVNVDPLPGEENGLHKDFDDVDRGYAHARHMGNAVAGAALQVYEKVKYVDVDEIKFNTITMKIPSNRPSPEEIPIAEKYKALHEAGRDDEIPFKGMALTTAVANSNRVLRLKDGPDFFEIPLHGVSLGKIALIGIPGEPFTAIGLEIKATEGPHELILPCALVNGSSGYYPTTEAYAEGGYETSSSSYKSGVAEIIVDEARRLLKTL